METVTLSPESITALSKGIATELIKGINERLTQEPADPLSEILHHHLDEVLAQQAKKEKEKERAARFARIEALQRRPIEPDPVHVRYNIARAQHGALGCPYCSQLIYLPKLDETADYSKIPVECHCKNGKNLVYDFLTNKLLKAEA